MNDLGLNKTAVSWSNKGVAEALNACLKKIGAIDTGDHRILMVEYTKVNKCK
jgi:hypothetical protein